ncbi:DUF1697 domain-containing protein, partial [Escherichia coli]|nr:DUF1697 domain-containing protein [Escherichia coli]
GCRDVAVMVRTEEHLRELVGLDPFEADGGAHRRFVTFLREPAPAALPPHRELEVVLARPGEVFSRLDKNVRNVSPNA